MLDWKDVPLVTLRSAQLRKSLIASWHILTRLERLIIDIEPWLAPTKRLPPE